MRKCGNRQIAPANRIRLVTIESVPKVADPNSSSDPDGSGGGVESGVSMLVIGGAGFIGSKFAEALLEPGHGVHVLDDLSTGSIRQRALPQGPHEP